MISAVEVESGHVIDPVIILPRRMVGPIALERIPKFSNATIFFVSNNIVN